MNNQLFFGDNLRVLRDSIADASVDLIYLDPPFNSKRDYNLLFKTPKPPKAVKTGKSASASALTAEEPEAEYGFGEAQITAFEDTWHWGRQDEDEFREILQHANTDVAELMRALRSFLKENDMMAYLTAMCIRLLELHRVLKTTGSLYLHCDPTASHYLKIVLDGVFGPERFDSEIIWRRYGSHNDSKTFGAVHDTILFYTKSSTFKFNKQHTAHEAEYVEERFRFADSDGRRWAEQNLSSPNPRPNLTYPFTAKNGIVYLPPANGWKYTRERMAQLDLDSRLHYPAKEGGRLRLKSYLDELPGAPVQDVWSDLLAIGGSSPERLGYPTQKPLALLERIIAASSNEGDLVLDPFCGCGTAVHAAQKLGRRWIGIDITHLAVSLIERRLKEAFPGIAFEVHGTPTDIAAARDLAERDKHQFQLWACGLVNAQPYQGGRKGADRGIDGLLYIEVGKNRTEKVIVQVKGGANVTRANIATLKGDVEREKAAVGLFITLAEPTREMLREATAAGHFETPHHGAVPKIQVLTIQALLAGQRPQLPDLSRGAQTFKKAGLEEKDGTKQQPGFDF
ncbi:MAG: DNA methyltransferase [Burkholderiaceae bacterium]